MVTQTCMHSSDIFMLHDSCSTSG